ncbi:hypothetical protein DDV96_03520 [Marixanthomonas spongiae]|uniref:T9SS C-terminal target domain-containing protein n=2 Tax=Marixanthomonas spongiae TaxID=2174845 RepID=A0A2U0I5P6_9FLAO|nr:hypothetical protein DDV96_03520 [Marixanthomonas spongiae]
MAWPVMNFAQAPDIDWQKASGGTGSDYPTQVQQTNDGGYILGGITFSSDGEITGSHGLFEYWLIKLSSAGSLSWEKALGGSNSDLCYDVQQTTDTGYIAAGWSNSNDGDVSNNYGNYDYWIVKLDSSGNLQWEKNYGGSGLD